MNYAARYKNIRRFNARLKFARSVLGYNQKIMSSKLGVAVGTYKVWETDKQMPTEVNQNRTDEIIKKLLNDINDDQESVTVINLDDINAKKITMYKNHAVMLTQELLDLIIEYKENNN